MKHHLFILGLLLASVSLNAYGNKYRDGVKAPLQVSLDAIPVCYDFGCKREAVVKLSPSDWRATVAFFTPAANTPAAEREQIKQAVGWMEVVIGRYTPTHNDLAFDLPRGAAEANAVFPGQLDCIDEAVNTTVYMRLFESMGLLKHHRVVEQAYRRSIFDQHWAGQIQERLSGEKFIVDSWFHPNGYQPVIQPSKSWKRLNILSAVIDNSPDEGTPVARSFWYRFLRGELLRGRDRAVSETRTNSRATQAPQRAHTTELERLR